MTVAPSTVTTLSEYADSLLVVCENSLMQTAEGVQDRVYVSPAPPAFDCEQLTIFVAGVAEAPTSPLTPSEEPALRARFGSVILVSYVIDSVRCSPSLDNLANPPSPLALMAAAHVVEDDMFALWNGIRHAHQNGEIFDGCLGVHFDGIIPLPDRGGFVGCEMRLRASIPGIPNV